MQNDNQLWYWIARSLSRETSVEEEEALQRRLQDDPVLLQHYNALKALWYSPSADETNSEEETRNISRILQLARVEDALHNPAEKKRPTLFQRKRVRRLLVYMGCLLVIAGSVFLYQQRVLNKSLLADASRKVIIAEKGSRIRTILPDGSTVWLNAGSKVEYDKNFSGPVRDVRLEGEAFFDVVKDPAHPFIVHADNLNIKVLGTAFNVRSYPGDKTIETTLLRGVIQVTDNNQAQQSPVYLHPNQKLVIAKETVQEEEKNRLFRREKAPVATVIAKDILLAKIDTTLKASERVETSWMYDRLEFKGDDFMELASKLERWYNVTISFEDERAKHITFNGSLENETLEQAFKALKTAVPSFDYTITNHEIFIRSSK